MGKLKNIYVYLHKDSFGNVFYVGSGAIYRASDASNRSDAWKKKVKSLKNKWTIEILGVFDKEKAKLLERELMRKYDSKHLLNIFSLRKLTKEHKEKISKSKKNQKTVTCNVCGKIGKSSAMKRWHFNNCKNLKP